MLNFPKPKVRLPNSLIPPREAEAKESTPPSEGKPVPIIPTGPIEVLLRGFTNLYQPVLFNKAESVTTTTFDLESPVVPPGRMWVITSLCAVDFTTGYSSLRWLIGQMGYDHFLDEHTALSANVLTSFRWLPIYLGEGKSLIARLTGITSGDRIRMFGNGVEVVLR